MTSRYVLPGALAFAVAGAAFGFVWVALEFPFAMALQWAVGAGLLGWVAGGPSLASREALAGGLVYLVVFTAATFVALSIAEFPVPLAVSAGLTGLAVGAVANGGEGAWKVGIAAFLGFALGELALAGVSALQPSSAAEPGVVQSVWFASGQAIAGLIGGAGVGAGMGWALPRGDGRTDGRP